MTNSREILFNYKDNKRRIEMIQYKYTGLKSVTYDSDKIQSGNNKHLENSIVQLLQDEEYNRIKKEIEIVEQVEKKLTERQRIVLENYFYLRKKANWIATTQPVSYATMFRDVKEIIRLLEKEISLN